MSLTPYLRHHSIRVFGRDGMEVSFGIFELRASIVGMLNVTEREGTVCFWNLNLIQNYNYNQSVFSLQYYQSKLFPYDLFQ